MWEDAPTAFAGDCVWSGGVCLTRSGLKRTVHEMQEAVYAKGLSTRALEMAERRYHQALTALMAHNCDEGAVPSDAVRMTTTLVGDSERKDTMDNGEVDIHRPAGQSVDTPAQIAEFEKLIDRVCLLHARRHKTPDVDQEYKDARLCLRTRILMLMAERTPRLIEILEENERHGDTR